LQRVEYRYEEKQLIVRVRASQPESLRSVAALALYAESVNPQLVFTNKDNPNPLFNIRSGANFQPVAGESGAFELRIPLFGENPLVDDRFSLRVALVDTLRQRTKYYDVAVPQ
jgi:hypothetical protein